MNLRTHWERFGVVALSGTARVAAFAVYVGAAKGASAQQGGQNYTIGLFGDMPNNTLGKCSTPTCKRKTGAGLSVF
jgi:hypothetical protein